jgi:Flp pilus assembly pilin Flp
LLSKIKQEDGAALVEYALILMLVATVLVTVVSTIGISVEGMFQSVVDKWPG